MFDILYHIGTFLNYDESLKCSLISKQYRIYKILRKKRYEFCCKKIPKSRRLMLGKCVKKQCTELRSFTAYPHFCFKVTSPYCKIHSKQYNMAGI